jgi:hypothetical protein
MVISGIAPLNNDVQEPAGDILGNQNRRMLVLRVPFSLNIPVLNGPYDVRFVRRAELHFDFISVAGLWILILQQQIEAAGARLNSLFVLQHEIAQAEHCGVFGDARESGYHRTYISMLERGKMKPSLRTLLSLATALNIHRAMTTPRNSLALGGPWFDRA